MQAGNLFGLGFDNATQAKETPPPSNIEYIWPSNSLEDNGTSDSLGLLNRMSSSDQNRENFKSQEIKSTKLSTITAITMLNIITDKLITKWRRVYLSTIVHHRHQKTHKEASSITVDRRL